MIIKEKWSSETNVPEWHLFEKDYLKGDYIYWMTIDDNVEAFAIITFTDDWIKLVAIQTNSLSLRKGYASTLFTHIMNEYSNSTFTLECDPDVEVLNFYSKLGFVWFGHSSNGHILIKSKQNLLELFDTMYGKDNFYRKHRECVQKGLHWNIAARQYQFR